MLKKTRLKTILDDYDVEDLALFNVTIYKDGTETQEVLWSATGESLIREMFRKYSQWFFVWDDDRPSWDTVAQPVTDFENAWSLFKYNNGHNWDRIINTLFKDYNPLENYDRTEDHTRASDWSKEHTDKGKLIGDSNIHSDTTTTQTNNLTDTQYATTYDNQTVDRKTGKVDNSGTVTTRNATAADSGDVAANRTHTETSYDNHGYDESGTDNITNEHTSVHGNIGVMSSQDMLKQELEVRKFNMLDYIIDSFAHDNLVTMGGVEDDNNSIFMF